MEFIKVSDNDVSIKLPLRSNRIRFSLLRTYFPGGSGLTYQIHEDKIGVEVFNEEFHLVPGVAEYTVFPENLAKKSDVVSDSKKQKVDHFMALINNQANNEKKKEKIKAVLKITRRKVAIGWKHRTSAFSKYFQMKEPFGGIRYLHLKVDTKYEFDEIKRLAVSVLKNEENSLYFEDATINLGNYENEVIQDFRDENGDLCDFWPFAKQIQSRNHRLRLYILTTKKYLYKRIKPAKTAFTLKEFPSVHFDHSEKSNELNAAVNDVIDVNRESEKPETKSISQKPSEGSSNTYENILSDHRRTLRELQNKSSLSQEKNNFPNIKLSVPYIKKDDIVFSQKVLGKGTFGTVRVANWLGTDVAVNSIRIYSKDKYILRELQVDQMDQIRHPNIVSLMAVSFDSIECNIVMEWFESSTLRSVLFDSKIKSQYDLNEKKKNFIGVQICKSITFLHEQCILHKDLKPENILVNIQCVTKICDLGLSKSTEMPLELFTTIGHNFKGTPMYMAPETLLDDKPATMESDIWALGCVMKELYTEENVWNIPPGTFGMLQSLKSVVMREKKSDLSKVPHDLKYVLNSCFQRDIKKRPKASTVLDIFKIVSD